jgi:hypothetical protein
MTATLEKKSRSDDPEPAPGTRRRTPGWLLTTAWYAALAVVTTIGAWWAIGLTKHPITVPLEYTGDALSGGASFKNVLERGWYEYNPHLGAPWGQHYHDFPLADNLHLMVAHVLGWFTDQYAVAFNLYDLITYPLAALTGAWFIRVVGGSRLAAFGFGLLFAFAPYHYYRGEGHLYLAAYYPIALAAGLVYKMLAGRPLWGRRVGGHALNPLTWVTSRSLWTVLILAMVGTASSYYAVFTVFFLAVSALALVFRRRWTSVGGSVVAMGGLMGVMVLNMLPDLLWTHERAINYVGLTRNQLATEVYAFKFAQLVLPVTWERIPALADLRAHYESTFGLSSEYPALGLVAAAGFLFLLGVALFSLVRVGQGPDDGFWATQRRLGFLSLFGFVVGTLGGLSTLFTLFVTDSIRGWNRLSIFLSLFALAALALCFDAAVTRVRSRFAPTACPFVVTGVGALALAVVVSGGLFDQTPRFDLPKWRRDTAAWKSDTRYVARIENAVPTDTMIFQLPYVEFPESPTIDRLVDSDPLRPYLHSTDLRWSYGGIKGRPLSDWSQSISADPVPRMLVEIGAAGFGGIHVDRFGYTRREDQALEKELTRLLGVQPIVSPDRRFAFFDTAAYNRTLKQRYPAATLEQIASHTVAHPVAYWQRDFILPSVDAPRPVVLRSYRDRATIFVDNPQRDSTQVQITFELASVGTPGRVHLTWPDGRTQRVGAARNSITLRRTVELPPGRSTLEMNFVRQPGTHGGLAVTGLVVDDTVLRLFPLK